MKGYKKSMNPSSWFHTVFSLYSDPSNTVPIIMPRNHIVIPSDDFHIYLYLMMSHVDSHSTLPTEIFLGNICQYLNIKSFYFTPRFILLLNVKYF